MVINAYFFDSIDGDITYSAQQFADAFGIVFQTGVLAKEAGGLDLRLCIRWNKFYNGIRWKSSSRRSFH